VQATTHRYDPDTHEGAVIADDGTVYPFTAEALESSGLRHLRVGQRLTVTLDPTATKVTAFHLGSIGALDRRSG
jgi:hypothetical protein